MRANLSVYASISPQLSVNDFLHSCHQLLILHFVQGNGPVLFGNVASESLKCANSALTLYNEAYFCY
jgi:hypothetical protein